MDIVIVIRKKLNRCTLKKLNKTYLTYMNEIKFKKITTNLDNKF